MMHASITLDKAYAIGQIDPRIYGSFVEHMGPHRIWRHL